MTISTWLGAAGARPRAAAAAVAPPALAQTLTVIVVSADGSTLEPPLAPAGASHAAAAATGSLYTVEGRWSFGAPPNADGNYPVLLDGVDAGWAVLLEIANGNLYAKDASGAYSVRWDQAWHACAQPQQGTIATGIALTLAAPSLLDNTAAGTVVAKAAVAMTPAGAQFGGALISSNPLYATDGLDIVLARELSPADDGIAPATITAVQ